MIFGRIAIPVGLAPTHVDGELALRTLCRKHKKPVTHPRWCDQHERALETKETVKGWQVAPGQFVLVEDEELEAIAPDAEQRGIEIFAFVAAGEIDPLWQKQSYLVAPAEQPMMRRAYGLLSAAMRETGAVALARFVAWRKEHTCVITRRAGDDKTLVLTVLRDPADLVSSAELDGQLVDTEPRPEEQELARELIGNLTRPLHKVDLADHGVERLRALLQDKLAGRKITRPKGAAKKAEPRAPADLSAALRKSIEATRKKRVGSHARPKKATSSRS